jgi:hypothetical protein
MSSWISMMTPHFCPHLLPPTPKTTLILKFWFMGESLVRIIKQMGPLVTHVLHLAFILSLLLPPDAHSFIQWPGPLKGSTSPGHLPKGCSREEDQKKTD